jgi:hypothetical protein
MLLVRRAFFVFILLLCWATHAESTPAPTPLFPPEASARAVFHPASFIATYRSGNSNTMTITGRFFQLYSLLDLSPVATLGFSDAASANISVFTSNANGAGIPLLPSLLTSNGNFFYTVTVNKRTGVARAVCRAVHNGNSPIFSFTATSDNPPTAGTFSMTFTVASPGMLPRTASKTAPQPTLQGLPNLTLQIGSAFFPATNIKRNRAVFP